MTGTPLIKILHVDILFLRFFFGLFEKRDQLFCVYTRSEREDLNDHDSHFEQLRG